MAAKRATSDNGSSPEDRLGQGLVALGQGTGGVRVSTAAVGWARRLCRPVVEQIEGDLEKSAPEALDVITGIGRAAALRVTTEGRIEIEARDLFEATRQVLQHRHSIICLKLNRELRRNRP